MYVSLRPPPFHDSPGTRDRALMKDTPRIVFMGTPDFAVPSLERLIKAGYPVVGVITATDKRGGRGGKKLLQSPVKKAALRHGIPLLQPPNLKAPDFLEALRGLNADLQIVVAFRMLPRAVWDMPRLGTFNLHGSLLPKYRGAAPINWAVMKGERETGATTFFIRQEIDTGDILLRTQLPIGRNETAGEVHDRMMIEGAELVVRTVGLIESGDYSLEKQDNAAATPAPKLHRDNCRIDWSRPAEEVHNFIRGLSPWPGAWTMMNNAQLKLLRSRVGTPETEPATPGTVITNDQNALSIVCGDGRTVIIEALQLAGRKRMDTNTFLNGIAIAPATVLG